MLWKIMVFFLVVIIFALLLKIFYMRKAIREIGLSIAKALIEKMDGNISADYSNNVLSIIIKLNEV